MTTELDYLRTGILEDELANCQAVIRYIVLAVEVQDRIIWNTAFDVARHLARRAGE